MFVFSILSMWEDNELFFVVVKSSISLVQGVFVFFTKLG